MGYMNKPMGGITQVPFTVSEVHVHTPEPETSITQALRKKIAGMQH